MARVQVNPIAGPAVTPQATPVGHFERTDAGAQLGQLAEALKGLAPELAQFGHTVFEQNKERDVKAGTAKGDELFQEVVQAGKQIKAGEIAPHESKWYRAAAAEQLGRLNAARFGSTLKTAMEDPNSPLAASTDPADFDAFAKDQMEQYQQSIGQQDNFFTAAFNEGANKEVLGLRDQFASQAGTRLQTQVIEATYQEHQQTIEEGLRAGLTVDQIGKQIYERNTIQYALNPTSGAALSNTMLRAVIDTARKTENLEVLDILKHIPGGTKGSTLANTSMANKLVPDAIQEIRASRQQRYALANTEDRDERKEQLEVALGSLYDTLDAAQAGGTPLSEDQLRTLAQSVNPEDAARVYKAADAYKKRTEVDDEATASDLWSRVYRGTATYDDISSAFEADHLTQATSSKMRAEIRANRAKKGAAKALTQMPVLQEAKTRLRNLFIDQYGINRPEMKLRAEFAVQDMENDWVNWRRGEGAGADDSKVNEWIHGAITRHFTGRADADLKQSFGDAFKGTVLPPAGTTGPQPERNWEKAQVVDPNFLGTLTVELDKIARQPNYRLPPSVEEVLRRNNVKNIEEAKAFLDKQRAFLSSN